MARQTSSHIVLRQILWVSILISGSGVILLGLLVIIGWYTGSKSLVQVLPAFVPMQYNTALGFIFCGAGLLFLVFRRPRFAAIAGALATVLGSLTLLEYVGGFNLGIDEFFMKHDITVKTSHPGRMAPNTAVCFCLVGLSSVVALGKPGRFRWTWVTVVLSSLSFGLAAVALSGYFTELETAYGWGNLTRMAVHTSLGFMVASLGTLALVWRGDISDDLLTPRWMPVPTTIAILTATLCLWQALAGAADRLSRQYDELSSLSNLATLMLIGGILLATAVGLTIYLAQKSGQRAAELVQSNLALTEEGEVRLRAEADLRKLTRVFHDASDPIILEDLDGNVVDLNSATERLYGWPRDELIGLPIKKLMPESRHEQADQLLEQCKNGTSIRNVEGLRLTKTGEELNVLITLSLLKTTEGVADGIVSFAKEITAQKNAEAELKTTAEQLAVHRDHLEQLVGKRTRELEEASHRAQAASRAKSDFLSHMSHELRTPLNGILGYAQILQRDPGLAGNHKNNVKSIMNCGEHLLALINDVLDLSKIEAGQLEVDSRPCNLHKLIRAVSDIVGERARSKGLKFEINVSPEVPQGIVTDESKVRQILINLTGNAVKFTSQGSVTIGVSESPKSVLLLEVIDTGVGITGEEIEVIFDAFKQVEAGKESGGTGLGLSICKKLAEALGGEIAVESKPGEGSTFSVSLPLVEADIGDGAAIVDDDDRESSLARLAPGQEPTILVADDRDTNRLVLQSLLETAGFSVILALDGREALDRLNDHPNIDLVLMDVRMPRMNGIEALQAIRADEQLNSLKVIAVTASVFPEFRRVAIESGFDDFIGKPFHADDLMKKLQTHLELEFESAVSTGSEHSPSADTATISANAVLSNDMLARLQESLRIKNLTAIKGLAQEVMTDPVTKEIGQKIEECANAFDFARLTKLLTEWENQSA